jgi:GR25 family glycosyltransferase involved in LPS biosynthesis
MSFEYCDHCFIINLKRRKDRLLHSFEQLARIGITNPTRFNAFDLTNNPALGCSLSHLKCLETAQENDWDSVMICEDDTTFLNPELLITQFHAFKTTEEFKNADVILLAGNNMSPFETFEHGTCIKVTHCLTTTCYIVKRHYYSTLIKNIRDSCRYLSVLKKKEEYAIDVYWLQLQKQNNWYLLIPVSVVQYANWSDIEKCDTNFTKHMLNYNKTKRL